MPIKNGNKPEMIGIKPELKIALTMPFELWGQINWSIAYEKHLFETSIKSVNLINIHVLDAAAAESHHFF